MMCPKKKLTSHGDQSPCKKCCGKGATLTTESLATSDEEPNVTAMIDLTKACEKAFEQDIEPDEKQLKQNVKQRIKETKEAVETLLAVLSQDETRERQIV